MLSFIKKKYTLAASILSTLNASVYLYSQNKTEENCYMYLYNN